MNGLAVCTTCGRAAFPAPVWCPACGGADWREEELGAGAVEETTFVQRAPGRRLDAAVRLGSVRLDVGPAIVSRLAPGRRAGRASGSSSRRARPSRGPSEAAPAPARPPLLDSARVSLRILLAEDETIIRLDLRDLLERTGFEVCAEARDGLEAVELARRRSPISPCWT